VSHASGRRAWVEPLWWCLFGAGGLCAAIAVPPLIALVALGALPEEALAYERVRTLVHEPPGLLFVLATIVLPAFHAMYRLRHTLHDLQVGRDPVAKRLTHALALSIGALALGLWWWGAAG
jgi:fumarate reductase subunit D